MLAFDFNAILAIDNFFSILSCWLEIAALFVLRIREPKRTRKFMCRLCCKCCPARQREDARGFKFARTSPRGSREEETVSTDIGLVVSVGGGDSGGSSGSGSAPQYGSLVTSDDEVESEAGAEAGAPPPVSLFYVPCHFISCESAHNLTRSSP